MSWQTEPVGTACRIFAGYAQNGGRAESAAVRQEVADSGEVFVAELLKRDGDETRTKQATKRER
jgi:hypothetical protein